MTILNTPRLSMRPIDFSDTSAIQTAAGERHVADTMISVPHPYQDGESDRYIKNSLLEREQGKAISFSILLKSGKQFLGLIEVREIEREHLQAELSFWLATEACGNGYMQEALKAVVSYCFVDLGLNRLYAYHMVRNPASCKVLEKSGFTQEGFLRQRVRKWGKFEDVILQAILKGEWQQNR